MGIIQLPSPIAANTGVIPNIKTMCTTDNLATITTAGYLNSVNLEGYPVATTDVLEIMYSFNPVTNVGTLGKFSVAINNGVITLSESTSSSGVNFVGELPTTEYAIAYYANADGDIGASGEYSVGHIGGLYSGDSSGEFGAAGALTIYGPSTGIMVIVCQDSPSYNSVTIQNAPFGQSATLTIPDPGAEAAEFLLTAGSQTMATGSQLAFDKGTATVVANACTLNAQSGSVTTQSLTLAQYATYSFVINNSLCYAARPVIATVNVTGAGNTTHGISIDANCGASQISVTLTNLNSTALNGTVIVNYLLL
jgi:hypothetical protein